MLDEADVVAFVGTADAARARPFYEQVLGLRLLADEPSALVFDGNGTTMRVQKLPELAPAAHTVLGWQVGDLAAAVDVLAGRGVVFRRYERLVHDHRGIWRSPSGAQVAWFADPDGNVLSLTQAP
jgi:catechol 2,3-dioxygenase-like lactoylglutathione lyase family enzyme